MALYIQTNVSALEAEQQFNSTENSLNGSMTKLSSGYRINSAADDAAGLGIAKSMNAQVVSYTVAAQNSNDAINMVQTADSAADQVDSLLTRMRQLAVEAQNGTMSPQDQQSLDTEFQQDVAEINRISQDTTFNGVALLSSGTAGAQFAITFQVGIFGTSNDEISVNMGGVDTTGLNLNGLGVSNFAAAAAAIASVDAAIQTLSTTRAGFGAAMNRLQYAAQSDQTQGNDLSGALATIQDVDVASETANLAREQVLAQAGASVLSQANQIPQLALKLLQQ